MEKPLFTPAKPEELLLGVWCPPPVSKEPGETLRRYRDLADVGVNLIWNAPEGALDACAEVGGLHALVHLPTTRDEADNTEACAAVAKRLKDHPALLGFNITDEPSGSWFPKLGAVRREVDALLPKGKLALCNLFPEYADTAQLSGSAPEGADEAGWLAANGMDYDEHVEAYMQTVAPRALSFDFYPLYENKTTALEYLRNMQTISKAAQRHGVPFHGFIQSISWTDHRVPTIEEYRWQMNVHFAFGAKAVSHFYYQAPYKDGGPEGFSSAPVTFDGEKTELYGRVRAANAEIRGLARAFLPFAHRETLLTGFSAEESAFTRIERRTGFGKLKSVAHKNGGKLVTGCFENGDVSGFYVVNYSFEQAAPVSLEFDGAAKYELWTQTGGFSCRGEGGGLELIIPPGESVFVAVA